MSSALQLGSSGLRNRWWGMVRRWVHGEETSVAPSLRVTGVVVVCPCLRGKKAPGRSFVSIVLSGLPLELGTVSRLPLCPSPPSPEQLIAASSCSAPFPTCCSSWSQSSLAKPCPGSLFLVAHGVESHNSILPHSRPHPLQPFNDPQPTATAHTLFPKHPARGARSGFLCFLLSLPAPAPIFPPSDLTRPLIVCLLDFAALLRLGLFVFHLSISHPSHPIWAVTTHS
jgi:hypothetical protein